MTRKRTEALRLGSAEGLQRPMKSRLPVAREGYPFILASLFFTLAVFSLTDWAPVEVFALALSIFVIAFFRDPEREVPGGEDSIVSPADGKVIRVEKVVDARFLNREALKVSIFMNLFNVHVNRVPASGRVLRTVYNPGKFFSANLDKASLLNEQNAVIAEGPGGKTFVFNQIAGLVARRIVSYAREGMRLEKGERYGLIRFGSRVDVMLPVDVTPAVKVGDKVKAGSSIIGYWGRGKNAR